MSEYKRPLALFNANIKNGVTIMFKMLNIGILP